MPGELSCQGRVVGTDVSRPFLFIPLQTKPLPVHDAAIICKNILATPHGIMREIIQLIREGFRVGDTISYGDSDMDSALNGISKNTLRLRVSVYVGSKVSALDKHRLRGVANQLLNDDSRVQTAAVVDDFRIILPNHLNKSFAVGL